MAPIEPKDREDAFFRGLDAEKISKMRKELDIKRQKEENQKRKDSHWMKCP